MLVTNVKYKQNRIFIKWIVEREGDNDEEHSLRCSDLPAPSFMQAWEGLAPVVVDEAELPEELVTFITPIGVSVSYYEDGRWGAVVSGLRVLDRSRTPLVLNTPHKPSEAGPSETTDQFILSAGSVGAIEEVLAEARRYVEGERAEQGLFDKKKEKTGASA